MTFTHPTLNAGYTYRFIYHPSMESTDDIKFTRVDNTTDYTTRRDVLSTTPLAVTPTSLKDTRVLTFAVPSDVPPLNIGYNNEYQGNTN